MYGRLSRAVAVSGGLSCFGAGLYGLYAHAPVGDPSVNDRDKSVYLTREAQLAQTPHFPEFVYNSARVVPFVLCTAVAKVYLGELNHVSLANENTLEQLVLERPPNQAIITVSNHTSTVDDPAIFACILPWKFAFFPSLSRWSLCSQEYCYLKNKFLSTFFFAAKTLPIRRGGGIQHKMLENAFEKVQNGDWLHIFPEGKIVQSGTLGGRESPMREEIGLLKWGVGKIIARADVTPIIVPIYHVGMENVMPQDKHKLRSFIPRIGKDVHVRIGDPIDVSDLILTYRQKKLKAETWESTELEHEVFSLITRRIEDALLELEKETYNDKFRGKIEEEKQAVQRHKARELLPRKST